MLQDLRNDAIWQQIEIESRAYRKAHPDFFRAISYKRPKLYIK